MKLKAKFDEKGEVMVYYCCVCNRISFIKACYRCRDENRISKGTIITLKCVSHTIDELKRTKGVPPFLLKK